MHVDVDIPFGHCTSDAQAIMVPVSDWGSGFMNSPYILLVPFVVL